MAEVITSEWIDNRVDCELEDKKRPNKFETFESFESLLYVDQCHT